VVIVALMVCSGTAFVAVDRLCYGNLSQLLPIYWNATVKSRTHNFLSEFGMGNTVLILTSPDDPDTVRSWYGKQTSAYLSEARRNNPPFYHLAHWQVDVTHNPDDPTGSSSQIILFGTCVQ
jgi:hypothetical protein